jgi:TatD DNase family protein
LTPSASISATLIDLHCHVDELLSPGTLLDAARSERIAVVAVSKDPRHFRRVQAQYASGDAYLKVAVGFHPSISAIAGLEREAFRTALGLTDYVGEIGLDGSIGDQAHRRRQLEAFEAIQAMLQLNPRIQSVHSRKAETDVLRTLVEHDALGVVWHWYSGPLTLIPKILAAGHYFSVNTAMLNRRGLVVRQIPIDRVLTETDAPYARGSKDKGPLQVRGCIARLARLWLCSEKEAASQILHNFRDLRGTIWPN